MKIVVIQDDCLYAVKEDGQDFDELTVFLKNLGTLSKSMLFREIQISDW